MNRERLLFVSILAIFGLWLALREPERPPAGAKPGSHKLVRRPVVDPSYPQRTLVRQLEGAAAPPWTRVTNERPHPRPLHELEKPKPFDLPNIWPPTSRSVSIDRLGLLRREAAAPRAGAAGIRLPAAAAREIGGVGAPAEDRVDLWRSKTIPQRGRVTHVVLGGKEVQVPDRGAGEKWPYGEKVLEERWKVLRALALLHDPERAKDEGVTGVWARGQTGTFKQSYPDEIADFQVAVDGKQRGYFEGLRKYLDARRGGEAFVQRRDEGLALLKDGLGATGERRTDLLRWTLALLDEALERVPPANQVVRRETLLVMLRAAGALNDYEEVLRLAMEHLALFPGEQEVLEHVGNVLASRSFSLAPFAVEWLKRTANRPTAQRRLVEVLVTEGRFEEAQEILGRGMAGTTGPGIDLLKARVALALGRLDEAAALAGRHASGDFAADARQILGAAAYARGDAAAAEREFLTAAEADPGRSTAFSDLGFACAVQGKAEDALACFARALELDPIDNAVAPELGRAYLRLARGEGRLRAADEAEEAGRRDPKLKAEKDAEAARLRSEATEEFAAAEAMLAKVREDNRADLFVRYMFGYAKERTGNLEEAAKLYRETIDGDARYRIAIARLGLVRARQVEAGGDRKLAAEAIAHLSKAVELSPQEAILPYVLARFLMTVREEAALATEMFARAEGLPVTERNGDLPFWAQLGRAWLAYADDKVEERVVKGMLSALLDRIRDRLPRTPEAELMKHPVYRAAAINLQIVEENEAKVDRSWSFVGGSRPPDWKYYVKRPFAAEVRRDKGLVFGGTCEYGGRRTDQLVLETCSVQYEPRDTLNGGSFWALEVAGVVPAGEADFGIGVVNPGSRGGEGPQGVRVRRKARTGGNVEVKLDGGDREPFKQARGKEWVDLSGVPWPAGEFRLRIEVVPEYGPPKSRRRAQGRFRLLLNGEEVFLRQFGDAEGEKSQIFSPGRASQPVRIDLWVEGQEGKEIQEIQVRTVQLTVETR